MLLRAIVALAALACAALGCDSGTVGRTLAWEIDLSAVSAADPRAVSARILRGGCDGMDVAHSIRWRIDEVPAGTPPGLPAGTYGFAADALDGACAIVGRGCEELDLPADEGASVRVRVTRSAAMAPECATAACAGGLCEPEMDGAIEPRLDGGDGGGDATLPDGASADAPTVDSGEDDAGGCPSACSMCSDGTCFIMPSDTAPVVCPDGMQCTVVCDAPDDCSRVSCGTGICAIDCMGESSCGEVECGAASTCAVSCRGMGTCGIVTCGTGACWVMCQGAASCSTVDCGSACPCNVTCEATACATAPSCRAGCSVDGGCSASGACASCP